MQEEMFPVDVGDEAGQVALVEDHEAFFAPGRVDDDALVGASFSQALGESSRDRIEGLDVKCRCALLPLFDGKSNVDPGEDVRETHGCNDRWVVQLDAIAALGDQLDLNSPLVEDGLRRRHAARERSRAGDECYECDGSSADHRRKATPR
ncbi:MAG: hypothetical protein IH885_00870 [Myxococcales bacterium]|nr:hypothetical protein [Myxococcales bacterium]